MKFSRSLSSFQRWNSFEFCLEFRSINSLRIEEELEVVRAAEALVSDINGCVPVDSRILLSAEGGWDGLLEA